MKIVKKFEKGVCIRNTAFRYQAEKYFICRLCSMGPLLEMKFIMLHVRNGRVPNPVLEFGIAYNREVSRK